MSVKHHHPEYEKMIKKWNLITYISSGEIRDYDDHVIVQKSNLTDDYYGNGGNLDKWECYLYLPDAGDYSIEAQRRRIEFVKGSVLYPATSRTINGSIGTVFRKPSTIDLSSKLEYLSEDADGNGLSIEQSMQESYKYTFSKGRCGLFVDFMSDTDQVTASDINNGNSGARILIYSPESIINWHVKRKGATKVLDMIVLEEPYLKAKNMYEYECCSQYRTLYIDKDGFYSVKVTKSGDEEFYHPLNDAGQRLNYIPFTFIGSDNNDYKVDDAPMYPIAEMNSKDLQYSAIRSESIRTLLPTGVFSVGDSFDYDEFNKENPNGIQLGQNKAYVLPGASFDLAQASPNDAASAEMVNLKERMIEAGALLITPNSSNISTDTAEIQQGIDTTTIAIVARNVEQAYNKALVFVADFMGDTDESTVEVNREYFDKSMSAQDRMAWASDVMSGNVTREEYRDAMKKEGLIAQDSESVLDDLPEGPLDDEPN